MRIAVVTRTLAPIGGIESYVALSSEGVRARGHEVHVLAEEPDRPTGDGRAERAGAARVLERVGDLAPDVIVSHGLSHPSDEARLLDRAPMVFVAHVYHGTCVGAAKTMSFPEPAPCTRALGHACLALYFPRRCGGLSPVTMLRQFALQRDRLQVIRRCQAVLAFSQHAVREYAANGVQPDRLHWLPPPVRQGLEPFRASAPDQLHVVFAGRLERLKGPAVLLDALGPASRLLGRPLRATFAGEGSYARELEQRAEAVRRAWPAVDVRFSGRLARADVEALFRTASVLAVPSLWPEPFGLVGPEAGAFGVPAVAFATGGIPDWLTDGVNGHVARDLGSAASLADAIVMAVSDPDHYARLREGAREQAARFGLEVHVEGLERILERVARVDRERRSLVAGQPAREHETPALVGIGRE
jgi:glycosyltransferase involved in cell wall biosynthesis